MNQASDRIPSIQDAAAIPKVSLHCHLLGSVPARTAVELLHRDGGALNLSAETIYDSAAYEDLGEFLSVYDRIGGALRTVDDCRRITYESLTAYGSEHNVWYREIFVSPQAIAALDYRDVLEGMLAGMRDAKADSGIDSRIIVAMNRERPAGEAMALLEQVIENRVDEVVGIGLDYEEVNGAPGQFARVYHRAAAAGLRRTAHSESGPPGNIEIILDELLCSRIDHGYHVVTDEKVLQRSVDEEIAFTCTPVSSDIGRYSGSGDGSHVRIAEMVDAGLKVCIDSDDPPMFGTDPTNDYHALAQALGYGVAQLTTFTRNAIDASWLDDTDKANLRTRLADHHHRSVNSDV